MKFVDQKQGHGGNKLARLTVSALSSRPAFIGMERVCQHQGSDQIAIPLFKSQSIT